MTSSVPELGVVTSGEGVVTSGEGVVTSELNAKHSQEDWGSHGDDPERGCWSHTSGSYHSASRTPSVVEGGVHVYARPEDDSAFRVEDGEGEVHIKSIFREHTPHHCQGKMPF